MPIYFFRLARPVVSKFFITATSVVLFSVMNQVAAADDSVLHKCSRIMSSMISSPPAWEIIKNRGFRYENLPNSRDIKYRVICQGDPSDSDPDVKIPKRPSCSPIGLEMVDLKNGYIYGLSDPRAFQDEGFLRQKKIRFQFQGKKWVMDTFKTDPDYFKLSLAKEVKNSNWPEMTLRPTVNSRKDFFEVNTEYLFKNHKTSIIEFLRLSNVCECAAPYPNLVLYAGMSQAANISLGNYCKLTPEKRSNYQTLLEQHFDKVVSRTPPELGRGGAGSDVRDATSTLARDTGNTGSDANVDEDGDDSGVSASADADGVSSNANVDGKSSTPSTSGASNGTGNQTVASIPGKTVGNSSDGSGNSSGGNSGGGSSNPSNNSSGDSSVAKGASTGNGTSPSSSGSGSNGNEGKSLDNAGGNQGNSGISRTVGSENTGNVEAQNGIPNNSKEGPKEGFDPDENEQAPKDASRSLEGNTAGSGDGNKTDASGKAVGQPTTDAGRAAGGPNESTKGASSNGNTNGGDAKGGDLASGKSNDGSKENPSTSASGKEDPNGEDSNQIKLGDRQLQPGEVSRQSTTDSSDESFGHGASAEVEALLNSMCPGCIHETITFQGIGRGKCLPGDVEKKNLVTGPDGGDHLFCDKGKKFVNPYVLEQMKGTIRTSTCRMYLYASSMVDTANFTITNIKGALDTDGEVPDGIKAAFDIVKTSLVFALTEIPACRSSDGPVASANTAFASFEKYAADMQGMGDKISFKSALDATMGLAADSVKAANKLIKDEGDLPALAKNYCSIVVPEEDRR